MSPAGHGCFLVFFHKERDRIPLFNSMSNRWFLSDFHLEGGTRAEGGTDYRG